uniref:Uncharacterized protein n=1 Tax=Anguilla anguilla TaxID=7936 RepID=A0A0E9S876_ANGAN
MYIILCLKFVFVFLFSRSSGSCLNSGCKHSQLNCV